MMKASRIMTTTKITMRITVMKFIKTVTTIITATSQSKNGINFTIKIS